MSIEALNWALNLAPVPEDAGGKPNPACAAVLVGLANHADPDGTGAFPSVDTLVRYTRLSERTVRTALDRLEAFGVIRPCDPALIAAKIKRADHRPKGWDLGLGLTRLDLSDDEIERMSRQFPGLKQRVECARRRGVQQLHPDARGAAVANDGVQQLQERGAAVAPEPSLNHPGNQNPPAPSEQVPPGLEAEPEPTPKRKGTRLPAVWEPDVALAEWARCQGVTTSAALLAITEVFRDHWVAVPGQRGTKIDWDATFRNWVRRDLERMAVEQRRSAGRQTPQERDREILEASLQRGLAARQQDPAQPAIEAPRRTPWST